MPKEEMRIAASRGSAENERWHVRKDGSRFFATGLLMPMRDGSRALVKILRHRTDQLHAERNQLRRLEQMKALADAARIIMSAADLSTTLDAVTVAARDIIGAKQAICNTTQGPDWSQAVTAVSLSDKYAAWRSYDKAPDGSGIYAWICEGNRTVRMTQADLKAHVLDSIEARHGSSLDSDHEIEVTADGKAPANCRKGGDARNGLARGGAPAGSSAEHELPPLPDGPAAHPPYTRG